MKLRRTDGGEEPLGHWLTNCVRFMLQGGSGRFQVCASKFYLDNDAGITALAVGKPEAAALGLNSALKIDSSELHARLARGVDAILEEVGATGDEEVIECLDYVLNQPAGSSPKVFENSPYPRDCDAQGLREDRKLRDGRGMSLAHFVKHRSARTAELTEAHVVALRLYTTAAFKSINAPLRDLNRRVAHPLAATTAFLTQGIKMLRAVSAQKQRERQEVDLWRGMRNLASTAEFEASGGTESAPMSTTTDPKVAIGYALGQNSLLFKVRTDGFMDCGADVDFLSAFPNEKEVLYPPLTYLKPTGRREHVEVEAQLGGDGEQVSTVMTVIEVEAQLG